MTANTAAFHATSEQKTDSAPPASACLAVRHSVLIFGVVLLLSLIMSSCRTIRDWSARLAGLQIVAEAAIMSQTEEDAIVRVEFRNLSEKWIVIAGHESGCVSCNGGDMFPLSIAPNSSLRTELRVPLRAIVGNQELTFLTTIPSQKRVRVSLSSR